MRRSRVVVFQIVEGNLRQPVRHAAAVFLRQYVTDEQCEFFQAGILVFCVERLDVPDALFRLVAQIRGGKETQQLFVERQRPVNIVELFLAARCAEQGIICKR